MLTKVKIALAVTCFFIGVYIYIVSGLEGEFVAVLVVVDILVLSGMLVVVEPAVMFVAAELVVVAAMIAGAGMVVVIEILVGAVVVIDNVAAPSCVCGF